MTKELERFCAELRKGALFYSTHVTDKHLRAAAAMLERVNKEVGFIVPRFLEDLNKDAAKAMKPEPRS